MLKLENITKDYATGSEVVHALRGVSLEFRKNEFVSILGPSGCGKTTLLNIIGGLDRYTSGDLMIDGKSTKNFKDGEWDAYRNNIVGMVFQTYNLIPHLSVLENVSIALTLSGVSMAERKERAKQALVDVGLEDKINKKPNQLSGGQMQRVAIARALVNNPDIILADEPTGALDSKTSVQVLEILKKISATKLVIMVTHNEQLADAYSDRIVKLVDGLITQDSNTYKNGHGKIQAEKLTNKKTSMSFFAALKLSFKNLLTKKKRTILTSIAGSIGIIGVALVLALSNGMNSFVNDMQSDLLAGFPLTVSQQITAERGMGDGANMVLGSGNKEGQFPEGDTVYSYDPSAREVTHTNVITQNYQDYLAAMDKNIYNAISYSYGMAMNVLAKTDSGGYQKIKTSSDVSSSEDLGDLFRGSGNYFNEIPDSEEFMKTQYDILSGEYPTEANELALVVDKYNRLNITILNQLGIEIKDDYSFSQLLGQEFRVIRNNDYYEEIGGVYKEKGESEYQTLYNGGFSVKVTGILRVKESASTELLSGGIGYTVKLTQKMLLDAKESEVSKAQQASQTSVLSGVTFSKYVTRESIMLKIGADVTPVGIQIYPKDFDSKDKIKAYLNAYNAGRPEAEQIVFSDLAESMTGTISTVLSTITIVLTALAAVSLVVSTIMIGIITYVSVVERTKEIGILRAVGARKKDISRIFNAETIIIGFVAGVLGVIVTYLLTIPINIIVKGLVGIAGIASLPIWYALLLVAGSMILTLIGGFIPSRGAAKKDPVLALRAE